MYGPGSIAVQCARKTFKFYSSGIYDDPKCSKYEVWSQLPNGYKESNICWKGFKFTLRIVVVANYHTSNAVWIKIIIIYNYITIREIFEFLCYDIYTEGTDELRK